MKLHSLPLAILVVLTSACTAGTSGGAGDTTDGGDASDDGGSSDGADASTSAPGDASSGDAGSSGETGAPADGETLYLQLCAPCHGADALGTELGYELRHPPRAFATWVVRNGRPGDEFPTSAMAAYPPEALSDAELESIFDFLDAFPQPTDPEGLYLDYCRNCHGPDAAGGVVGQNISDQEAHDVFEKVREGENTGNPGARTAYMPAFDTATLSDDEVQQIADYIAGL